MVKLSEIMINYFRTLCVEENCLTCALRKNSRSKGYEDPHYKVSRKKWEMVKGQITVYC